MELRQLYYLSVCAETKSFTKAANVLYTAQSNVSKVIRSLEEELGVELFERKQYGIALTPAGRQVYEQAQTTLSSARKIQEYARNGQRQELRICCNPDKWMSDAFVDYYQEHHADDVHYSMITAETGQIIERLARGSDQLGFVYVMESRLPLLQTRLEKEHLFCTMLGRTKIDLQPGAGTDLTGGAVSLVQGFEDEFSIPIYRREEKPGKGELPAEQNRVAVTTNSDYIMRELMRRSSLAHVGPGCPGVSEKMLPEEENVSLEEHVLFGYVTRNDRNPDPQAIRFLNFIRMRLKNQKELI